MTQLPPGGSSEQLSELERLRAENRRLHEQLSRVGGRRSRRAVVSIVAAVLLGLLVPMSAATVWAERTMLDTDSYVTTVEPLAREPAVQQRVADVLTETISDEVDFEAVASDLLPDDLQDLVAPLAGGARVLVRQAVEGVVSSEQFAELWAGANQAGHTAVRAVMIGEKSELFDTRAGQIAIRLGPIMEEVVRTADDFLGTDLVGDLDLRSIDATYVLFESQDLGRTQEVFGLLDSLGWFMPLATIGVGVGAVLAAKDRRIGLRRIGLALVVSSLAAIILMAIVRGRVTGVGSDADAVRVTFETVTRFLVRELRATAVLGALLILGAWLAGPARSAQRARDSWHRAFRRASESVEPAPLGPVPSWANEHRRALRIGAVALAAALLLAWARPTGLVVLLIGLLLLLTLAAIELLARVGTVPDPPAEGSG